MQAIFTMHRFIIVDAHTIKVCDLNGELVSVPLGPQGNLSGGQDSDANPNAIKMGPYTDGKGGKNISWRQYIENGMDRPRIMWDGSFLWITETQLRKTDDNQLKMPNYIWHCYAPMTWNAHLPTQPDQKRAYGKRCYMDISISWDQDGKLHSHLRDPNANLTPGTLPGSTACPPTPAQVSFAPQTSVFHVHLLYACGRACVAHSPCSAHVLRQRVTTLDASKHARMRASAQSHLILTPERCVASGCRVLTTARVYTTTSTIRRTSSAPTQQRAKRMGKRPRRLGGSSRCHCESVRI